MNIDQLIQTIALAAIPVLFAITLHEAAHGYVARHFGDMTAYQQGRISLNPLRHIDPIGTVLFPLLTLWLGGILFGWAKPVPVNFAALRRPKQDMLWVAIAGPATNLIMALGWAFFYKMAWSYPGSYFAEPLQGMAEWGIRINVILMVLNLLPHRQAYQLSKIEPYGMFILILLVISGVLGLILFPLVTLVFKFISFLIGL